MFPIITTLIVFSLFLLNQKYKKSNHWKNKVNDIDEISLQLEDSTPINIVSIGSSQCKYAFDFKNLHDIRGVNLSARPQSLEYSFKLLRKHINKIENNGICIISICILDFYLREFKNNWDNIKYVPLLNKELSKVSLLNKISQLYFPVIFHPYNLRYVLKDVRLRDTLSIDQNLCKSSKKLDEDAQYWIKAWNTEFGISIPKSVVNDRLSKNINENKRILVSLIGLLQHRGIIPILVVPPVTTHLQELFSDNFLNAVLFDNLYEVAHGKLPVMNYLGDKEFKDDSLFLNSFFLNCLGRKKFTSRVLNDIKKNFPEL